MTSKAARREVNLHVRVTREMYDALLEASGASPTGETVSDIARAGMQREIDLRRKREERNG